MATTHKHQVTWKDLQAALQEDDGAGFCLDCGGLQYECEPDARNYACENCGANRVYGAEEILLMGAYRGGDMGREGQ